MLLGRKGLKIALLGLGRIKGGICVRVYVCVLLFIKKQKNWNMQEKKKKSSMKKNLMFQCNKISIVEYM